MKKVRPISTLLAMAMALCMALSAALAEETVDPAQLINDLKGTYTELFTTICDPAYDDVWLERCAAYVGEENAEAVAAMLKSACTGRLYGQEAVDAYAAAPESTQFDCYFLGGVSQFVFDGNRVTGLDGEGKEVFSHEYAYVETLENTIACYAYKTEDADASEFAYLCLAPDTPASTYHIEFRYGSDLDALAPLYEGPYAYWLAAGIPADADEAMIHNCIDLYCAENSAEE